MASYTVNTLYIGFKEFLYADHKNEKLKKTMAVVFYWETLKLKEVENLFLMKITCT